MRKKTVVFNSDLISLRTGLARNAKAVMTYLYNTNKYNLIYYSCGTPWDSPEYSRFPFKVIGTLPNNPQEWQQISADPAQARFASYGGYYIDRVVKECKPDVLIMSNDHWAMDSWISRPWWNKIHCISHVTVDSLPLLNPNIELIKNSKHYFTWAPFAENEAKKLGFNHVQTLTGAVKDTDFYRLGDSQKRKLREKFNLPLDSFIVGYVFRNQLRKELKPIMEGFKLFINENPKIPAYLLLHTNFSEPAGWNIPAFCQEIGIDPSRILTTYICGGCKSYEIKSFVGENQKCPYCGAENDKGQTTCNVSKGVTEEELNEIYNLMDCVPHLFNAGGLEYPMVEALFCEIPLATVPYSSGEMFTNNDFVYTIDVHYTVQHGTQFKRSVPIPFSVYKFLKRIYNLSAEEKRKIGQAGRKWALENFSVNVIGKKWEDLLDSLPLIDWDFEIKVESKNPAADLSDIENANDDVFIKESYKRILNMTVDENDSGYKYWAKSIAE